MKTPVELPRSLPLLLLQVREAVMQRFRPMLNTAGLTEQQWRVLRALLNEGPLEPRQIVTLCCLSSASLVGILVRMQDMGLITRTPIPGDQRRVLIKAAPKGQRLAKKLMGQIQDIYAKVSTDLGSDLMGNLMQNLDSAISKLKDSMPVSLD